MHLLTFNSARQRAFCCTPESGESLFLPVPLEYLFDEVPENADDPDFNLQIDDTWGTGETKSDEEDEPNVCKPCIEKQKFDEADSFRMLPSALWSSLLRTRCTSAWISVMVRLGS